jgi:formylglycine-generating enzyme required for sulfatase activity
VVVVDVAGGTAAGSDWYYVGSSVSVSAFKMDKTEVTVAQYAACVTAGQCSAPNTVANCNWQVAGRDSHPVNCVDWYQATAFCTWAGKRLPTEVEWQWAASSGGTTIYPWGGTAPDDTHAQWSGVSSKSGTAQVGTHTAGNTAGGIQDMSGNVWEWTASEYSPGAGVKSIRGGSWYDANENYLRAAYRAYVSPAERFYRRGFRCAQ